MFSPDRATLRSAGFVVLLTGTFLLVNSQVVYAASGNSETGWVIEVAFRVPLLKILTRPAQKVADTYDNVVVDTLGLKSLLLAWAFVFAGVAVAVGAAVAALPGGPIARAEATAVRAEQSLAA